MHISTDYNWPFLLLCLALAVGVAALGYARNRRFAPPLRWTLAAVRALAVALLAFLLLSPFVRRQQTQQQKPIVVLLEDASQSVVLTADSAYYRTAFPEALQQAADEIGTHFDVHRYRYGSRLVPATDDNPYDAPTTDLAGALADVADRYARQNVAAVVLTGDGIVNRGRNPLDLVAQLPCPLFAVALGDTTVRRDATVAHLRCNRVAFLGNLFPVEITLHATHLASTSVPLTVTHDGRTLHHETLRYTSDDFSTTLTLMLEADQPGVQQYTVAVGVADGEASADNNRRTFTVEVLDAHKKIALLAAAPHPDIAALKQSLEQNDRYEVSSQLARDFRGRPTDFDLFLLHQLPSSADDEALVHTLVQAHVPLLFVLGPHTDFVRFNALRTGLEIRPQSARPNDASALFNSAFTLFGLAPGTAEALEALPPLASPFAKYKLAGNAQTLLTARIGNVDSRQPLVAFVGQQETRYGFVAGDGLWRWRLHDHLQNGSAQHFDDLVEKAVVYTSLRLDGDPLRVRAEAVWQAGDVVEIEAELLDESYQPVNTPDVQLEVTPDSGSAQQYTFNRVGDHYRLQLGTLPPGRYRYRATTHFNGRDLTAQGLWVVEPTHLEALNLVADHSFLHTLAHATGGLLLRPADLPRLPELLRQQTDSRPLLYTSTRYTELLRLPLLLVLVLLLLSIEWVARKMNGEI